MDNSTSRNVCASSGNFEGASQERSEAARASSVNPYTFIWQWWGEELSDELILRVKAAPKTHIRAFLDDWGAASRLSRDLFKSALALPPLRAGTLRPLVRGYGIESVSFSLSMSLYCHEVVLENPLGDFEGLRDFAIKAQPGDWTAVFGTPAGRSPDNEGLVGAFRDLLILKPLVNAGVIHLRVMPCYVDGKRFIDWILSDGDETAQILFESAGRAVGWDWLDALDDQTDQDLFESPKLLSVDRKAYARTTGGFGFISYPGPEIYFDMVWSFFLYSRSEGRGQLMIRDSVAADRIRSALLRIGQVDDDLRGITMRKLAALSVPLLQRKIPDLMSIRASEDVFADWRRSLSLALAQVENIQPGDAQDWNRQASAIVHAELEPFRQAFQDVATKSPALRALQSGFASLGIEAIGAAAGAAVGGGASGAFTGLAAGKAANTLVSYLKALKERRSARALLDVAFMFNPKGS